MLRNNNEAEGIALLQHGIDSKTDTQTNRTKLRPKKQINIYMDKQFLAKK